MKESRAGSSDRGEELKTDTTRRCVARVESASMCDDKEMFECAEVTGEVVDDDRRRDGSCSVSALRHSTLYCGSRQNIKAAERHLPRGLGMASPSQEPPPVTPHSCENSSYNNQYCTFD